MRDPGTYKSVVMKLLSYGVDNTAQWIQDHLADLQNKTEQDINTYIDNQYNHDLDRTYALNINLIQSETQNSIVVIEDKTIGKDTWIAACEGLPLEVRSSNGISNMLRLLSDINHGTTVYVFYDNIGPDVTSYKNVHITYCNIKQLHEIKMFCALPENSGVFKCVTAYTGFESSVLSFEDWVEWLDTAPGSSSDTYMHELQDINFLLSLREVDHFEINDLNRLYNINRRLGVYGSLEKTTAAMLQYVLGRSQIRIGKTSLGECFMKNCLSCKKCSLYTKVTNRSQKLRYIFRRTYGFKILEEMLNAQCL